MVYAAPPPPSWLIGIQSLPMDLPITVAATPAERALYVTWATPSGAPPEQDAARFDQTVTTSTIAALIAELRWLYPDEPLLDELEREVLILGDNILLPRP